MSIRSRRDFRQGGIWETGLRRAGLAAALALLLMAGAGWGGYQLGLHDSDVPEARLVSSLRDLFDAERRDLEEEKQRTEAHLNGLALSLGQQQARLLRLEALGEQLVEMGRLEAAEFDFNQAPPVGGPEDPDQIPVSLPEMLQDMENLSRRIDDREVKLAMLEDLMLNRGVQEAAHPSGRPVKAGWISSYYGWRKDPISGRKAMHRGLDFAGKTGSDILAVADGVVEFAGTKAGFGKLVEIRHGNGYVTRYGHNRTLLVERGDVVHQGQVIARMGRTGRATGTHLHFEVIRDGKTVNPLKFVKKARVKTSQG